MGNLLLSCWNYNCLGTFKLECKNSDQTLFCDSCKEIATFVNLGYFKCSRCKKISEVKLESINKIIDIRCCHCNSLFLGAGNFKIYTLEMIVKDQGQSFGLQYCGRDSFEGLNDEVRRGKEIIKNILERGKWKMLFGQKNRIDKNVIFINRLGPMSYPGKKIPVDYLQYYHALCNYRLYSDHENAKFLGVLGQFADSSVFDMIVKPGINEIWFSDNKTRSEFEYLKSLSKYHNLFNTV